MTKQTQSKYLRRREEQELRERTMIRFGVTLDWIEKVALFKSTA